MKRRGGNKRRLKAARRAWRKRIHLLKWMRETLDRIVGEESFTDGVDHLRIGAKVHQEILANPRRFGRK